MGITPGVAHPIPAPDAHVKAPSPVSMEILAVEAPSPVSMEILAGILLKMGGHGILRICYPVCPEARTPHDGLRQYGLWCIRSSGVKEITRMTDYATVMSVTWDMWHERVLATGTWGVQYNVPSVTTSGRTSRLWCNCSCGFANVLFGCFFF